jgi:hypothetical protein
MKKQTQFAAQVAKDFTPSPEGFALTDTQPGVMVPVWKKPDEETGEYTSKYRYLEGRPHQIRFDAKEGHFTVEGKEILGPSLTFQPLAWRIFEDDILNYGRKKWAELFFADERHRICAVLFHGFSVENLLNLRESLFYNEKSLTQVCLTATAERKENTKISPKAVYYIAEFGYVEGDQEAVAEGAAFTLDNFVYRDETFTPNAVVKFQHGYRVPRLQADEATGLKLAA